MWNDFHNSKCFCRFIGYVKAIKFANFKGLSLRAGEPVSIVCRNLFFSQERSIFINSLVMNHDCYGCANKFHFFNKIILKNSRRTCILRACTEFLDRK